MKLVIDIPDGCYEELNSGRFPLQDAYRLVAWIKNGTPLPEHHGRLIDADVLIDEMPTDICDGYEAIDVIERTSTIIEGSDSK